MRLRLGVILLSASIVAVLGGCDANQLYMGSKTVVGVNAAVSPDHAKGWLVVGYDRTFAAVIPRSVEARPTPETQPSGKQDAMASMACSRLVVSGITVKYFKESIATGEAAQTFAQKLDTTDVRTVKDFFDCFKKKPAPETTTQTGGAER